MSAITDFLNQDGLNTLWSKIKTYISNKYVAKETGKGLSTNDFTAAYKKLLDSIDSTVGNTSNLVKNSAVNKAISDLKTQIGNLKTINIKVVTELPTSGQESNVIYLIKHAHTGATNIRTDAAETYDEYLWVAGDGKFEKIGNTDIDLSAYAKTADIKDIKVNKAFTADTADKLRYPLTIHLASSSTTYDGSAVQGVQITPDSIGAAPSDHRHPAWQITGTLSINQGGTGADNPAMARVFLGAAANTDFTASTSQAAGAHGLVPAPPKAIPFNSYLGADTKWHGFPSIPAAANNATIAVVVNGVSKSFTTNQGSNATLDFGTVGTVDSALPVGTDNDTATSDTIIGALKAAGFTTVKVADLT